MSSMDLDGGADIALKSIMPQDLGGGIDIPIGVVVGRSMDPVPVLGVRFVNQTPNRNIRLEW